MGEKQDNVGLGSRLIGYGTGLAALGAAAAIHFTCLHTVGITGAGVFFVYLLSVLAAAWCGYGPGALVLILALTVLPYLYNPKFSPKNLDKTGVLALIFLWLVTSYISASRKRRELVLRDANSTLDARMREQTAVLEQRLTELEILYAQVPLGLGFLNSDLRFLRANDHLAAMNGIPTEAHIGRRFGELVPKDLADPLEQQFQHLLETGAALVAFEVHGPSPKQADIEVDWMVRCCPVHSPDGSVAGLQIVIRDITDQKRAESTLRESNEQLRRLNAELEQFAFVAAHDLQEPLRTINIYTELLLRLNSPQNRETTQYAAYVSEAVERMRRLIGDLVTYSKVVHQDEDHAGSADLNICFENALAAVQPELSQTGSYITRERLPVVKADPGQIQQVFHNLLSNAIKYRKPGEAVRLDIGACHVDGEWVVSIRDQGIGFDSRYSERIFGLFKRLHGAQQIPGTGLGLAISRRIVERSGGRLWAESQSGAGATFYIALKAAGKGTPDQSGDGQANGAAV